MEPVWDIWRKKDLQNILTVEHSGSSIWDYFSSTGFGKLTYNRYWIGWCINSRVKKCFLFLENFSNYREVVIFFESPASIIFVCHLKRIKSFFFFLLNSELVSLFVWVLWHINLCRLFNAKSIFIQTNISISNNSV